MRIQVADPHYDGCVFSPSELSTVWLHWGTDLSGLPSPVSRVGVLRQFVTP